MACLLTYAEFTFMHICCVKYMVNNNIKYLVELSFYKRVTWKGPYSHNLSFRYFSKNAREEITRNKRNPVYSFDDVSQRSKKEDTLIQILPANFCISITITFQWAIFFSHNSGQNYKKKTKHIQVKVLHWYFVVRPWKN